MENRGIVYRQLIKEGRIVELTDGAVQVFDQQGRLQALFNLDDLQGGTVDTVMSYIEQMQDGKQPRQIKVHLELAPFYLYFGWKGFSYEGRLWNIIIVAILMGLWISSW